MNGISIMNAIAYSSGGNMRCGSCGKNLALSRFGSILYKFLEGVLLLISIFYSFYLYSSWPIMLLIPLIIFVRAFLLPQFAYKVKNKSFWRKNK